ncbi:hypothetical protein AAU57_06580 [Nonlabens sp. YIK11]|uniref:hypothetical protein n=1 Tax=Nonlabens sp. YIK11 TaxID=1453349 RepID=UPI0006DD151A|nr:hypothetical protein [Nonlabens sp. YIK11]KQC33023.1 hypothetical protein AAU57_06580 [Nonlabens sp. YIK11]
MAKQKSLLKVEGTLDGMTFYKTGDGYLVRTKGGVSKSRIDNDPAFARTRENGREFGHTAQSGKVLRNAIRPMLLQAKDKRVSSRMVKIMSQIKNQDQTNMRGYRNVATGIATPEGKLALQGFDFNNQAVLGSILYAPYELDSVTGTLQINGLVPNRDIVPPNGSTHVSMSLGVASINFETGESQLRQSTETVFAVGDTVSSDVTLVPSSLPAELGVTVYLLLLSFSQQVNGVHYALNNGSYNVLNLIAVG